MKRLLVAGIASVGVWLVAQTVPAPRPMSELIPAGAMVYLESKNFQTLVADWKGSGEKASWMAGANYQVFSRSMLYGRLERVFNEYATGIGVPPNMDLLSSVAGTETALAVYDINRIEFLYVTKLASARAMESLLWKAREQFTARNAAGQGYYVKTSGQPKRTACFSISGDWLLVATKEDALIAALSLLGRGTAIPIRREQWFDTAVRAAPQAGELRMVLNMQKLTAARAFRSYWLQRNGAELEQYSAAVSDLRRSAAEFREERLLLRADATAAPDASSAAALASLAPADAGLYRVWAHPSAAMVSDLVARKISRPGATIGATSKSAPVVSIEAGSTGSETDLESRLDEAPYQPGGIATDVLTQYAAANAARALLHVQRSRTLGDGVFIGNDSAIVIEGASDWPNPPAIEAAIAVRGKRLYIATRKELLDELLARNAAPAAGGSTYEATYRLTGEAARYKQMTRMIERSDPNAAAGNEPRYFSENLASLADTLKRVQSVDVREVDSGNMVRQTVAYKLGR